jgi:hypothetical protein
LDLNCNAGSYLTKANKCQLCPVGTWSSAGAKKCATCPAGTKTSDHLSCKDCAAGKFSGAGSAKCKPCGVGQVSQRKASNCTACAAGQYASRSDNICTPCAKGTYSTGSVDSCTNCTVGSYSDPGETKCTPCLPGQQYNSKKTPFSYDSGCQSCYSSTYSPEPYTACKKCPAEMYSSYGASACSVCDAKKGYVADDSQQICVCPNGSEFDNVLQACSVCKPGYKMKTEEGGCEACGPKTYNPRVGWKVCQLCSDHKLVNPDRTRCDYCPASFGKSQVEDKCVKCPAGQYSTADIKGCRDCLGMTRVNDAQTGCVDTSMEPPFISKVCLPGQGYFKEICTDCGPGYMSSSQTCIPCRVGAYSNTARPASCITCASPMVVSADRTKCEYCEPSFYRQEFPQDNPESSPGREAKCMKCPAGTYSTSQGTGCLECPNYTPVNAAQTGCDPVSAGPILPPTPPRTKPGTVWDVATQSIKDCPAGYEKLYSFQSCTPCMVGYYSKLPGTAMCSLCGISKLVTPDRTDCVPCLPGYTKAPYKVGIYPYTGEKEGYCIKCPQNMISEGGQCEKCPKGKIPNKDQTSCVTPGDSECPLDQTYDSSVGECVQCSPGHALYAPNRPCGPCYFNNYQPYYGQTSCLQCPYYMAVGVGRDDCFFCEASYYSIYFRYLPSHSEFPRIMPATTCEKCEPGTYSVYADRRCHTCPVGKTVNAGQTGCE